VRVRQGGGDSDVAADRFGRKKRKREKRLATVSMDRREEAAQQTRGAYCVCTKN